MITIWKKIKEEPFKAGFRKLIKRTFQMPDEKIADFDIKHEGPVVCVLALTEKNRVVLVQQFRPGPEKILLEMPGGAMEDGEEPMQAMERELLEETGYSGNLKFVGASFTCAYSTSIKYNFVATSCQKIKEQKLEANEFADVVEMNLEDFRKHLREGNLTDVECGYLGLDFLGML